MHSRCSDPLYVDQRTNVPCLDSASRYCRSSASVIVVPTLKELEEVFPVMIFSQFALFLALESDPYARVGHLHIATYLFQQYHYFEV